MRFLLRFVLAAALLGVLTTVGAAVLLPDRLLRGPVPARTPEEVARRMEGLRGPGEHWSEHEVLGGEDAVLHLRWLHRPASRGVALFLHGFGDDALGTVGYASQLRDWDALCFTFRGRDLHPELPSTLGAWERADVAAVVAFLERQGIPRSRLLLVGVSQGAGVALLALADLERGGAPLGGALLESPYRDLRDAARNHLRGALGPWELLLRGSEGLALWRAGALAHFDPDSVSPLEACRGLRTPMALLAGDVDGVTPLEGVRAIARFHPDLTIVRGAGHGEAGAKVPGGWGAWAHSRLDRWRI